MRSVSWSYHSERIEKILGVTTTWGKAYQAMEISLNQVHIKTDRATHILPGNGNICESSSYQDWQSYTYNEPESQRSPGISNVSGVKIASMLRGYNERMSQYHQVCNNSESKPTLWWKCFWVEFISRMTELQAWVEGSTAERMWQDYCSCNEPVLEPVPGIENVSESGSYRGWQNYSGPESKFSRDRECFEVEVMSRLVGI